MREGAEPRKVEVILSNCTAMTRVHMFGSVFAGAFDTEMQLTGLIEGRQAEVQTAKVAGFFYKSEKRMGTEQEYIQRRQTAAARLGNTLDAPSVLMHGVVTQETWRKETSACAGDAICGGAASGEMMADMMARKRKKMMMNGAMEGGMGGVRNWRRSLADWKNIDFLGETTTVVLNEAPGEGKRRRVVVPMEVIAGKGQSTVTVVATDDEHVVAKVVGVDLSLCGGRRKTEGREGEEGEEGEGRLREMRLMNVFDPKKHVLQKMHSALILPEKVLRSRCWDAGDEKDEEKKEEKKEEKEGEGGENKIKM
ncbi:uncharacterized protein MONOS_18130 [Monocercomonoides exilis]|uniref:uncharacterized protein n=1 Tax=Monocercomonoides exilis TaxID=2049356 RepID=UPI0035599C5B|nr:hypothetical protein MONOS_18130 [Monocercomonoides exilis]